MEPEDPQITAARIARETAWIQHRTARVGLLGQLVALATALGPSVAAVIVAALLG